MVVAQQNFGMSESQFRRQSHSREILERCSRSTIGAEIKQVAQVKNARSVFPRKRAVLTYEMAREIFALQLYSNDESGEYTSLRLSKLYGVSPKAIRDIWNR